MTDFGNIKTPQGDLLLFTTVDGGEFDIEGGEPRMEVFLYTAVYLSLFGGNKNDPVGDDDKYSWWGNRDETDPVYQYRSRTQNIMDSLPATSANIRRIEEAAFADLAWIKEGRICDELNLGAQLTGQNPKRLEMLVIVTANGEQHTFQFVENWLAAAEEEGGRGAGEEGGIILVTDTDEWIYDDETGRFLVE